MPSDDTKSGSTALSFDYDRAFVIAMKKVISTSEIVECIQCDGAEWEVCATAEANLDESKSQLVVALDSFVRLVNLCAKEKHILADWLPKKQNVKESVSPEEAPDLAKDIFHRWVGKVRQSVPSTIHN